MMQDEHIPQEDLVLYAMQAMRSHELAAVRVHLDRCAECRQALAEVNGDLALLAVSVDPKPLPEGARERSIARMTSEPSQAAGAGSSVIGIDSKRPARHAAVWIGWLAAAASLLFAFSQEQKVRSLNEQLAQQQQAAAQQAEANARAKQVLDVLTAPTANRVLLTAAKAKPEPSGRAVYLAESGGLVFQASDLAQLAQDKAYELWVIPANGQAPIAAGTFRPDAAGSASVLMPPLPKGVPAKAFGVTIEKAEGSATPTTPIILVGAVPASGE
ncbi:anti-sigma factor [Telmatobacter sp. DSM 110680]|uniref:Regulator of SigK n=1 Tax=Telmatobacter sp. DSM 110680 TaxID=3036704 RepID=A0AAU7DQD4_9BACT